MSNLLTTANGREAMRQATIEQILHRMSRFFHRNVVIAFENWVNGGNFDISVVLGQLNDLHDPEILNWLSVLGLMGGLQSSLVDTDIVVSSLGDDTTGIGTTDYPLATIGEAISRLPKNIDHGYRILAQHDSGAAYTTYVDDVVQFNSNIRAGFLSLLGVGSPVVLRTGDVLTGATILGSNGGIQYSTAGGWGVDAYQGSWMLATSGAAAGQAIPVLHNDFDNLWCRYHINAPIIGDTFDFVTPSIRWKLNQLTINYDGTQRDDLSEGIIPVGLANMELDFSDSPMNTKALEISGKNRDRAFFMDFVVMVSDDNSEDDVHLVNTRFNPDDVGTMDPAISAETGLTGTIDNIYTQSAASRQVCGFNWVRETRGLLTKRCMIAENCSLSNAMFADLIRLMSSETDSAAVGCIENSPGFNMVISSTLVWGTLWDAPILVSRGRAEFASSFVYLGNYAVACYFGECYFRNTMECSPTIVNYAFLCSTNARCQTAGALAGFTGVIGDAVFTAPNPDVGVAWPGAGGWVTDGMGANISRAG